MARARNIKPSLFSNDILADIEPLGRLLFIGLWTIADYKGDIEWRSKRIKAQILPYDNCDIDEIMINLDKSGFVRFYSDGENIYVNITNFTKHQNPHKNEREKGSDIPEYSESMRQVVDLSTLTINRDKSRINQDENETNPADSFNPIPDSLEPIEESDRSIDQSRIQELLIEGFDHFWDIWKAEKKRLGKTDTSPKGKTFDSKWKKMFNSKWWSNHSEQDYRDKVNQICDFVEEAHRVDGFNRFENMQTGRFFTERQWED